MDLRSDYEMSELNQGATARDERKEKTEDEDDMRAMERTQLTRV